MHGFMKSLRPLFGRLRELNYKTETILLIVGGLTLLTTVLMYVFWKSPSQNNGDVVMVEKDIKPTPYPRSQYIGVDVSGAVINPSVYTLKYGARIHDAISQAGGLSQEADDAFVARNINMARILSDQEKIYIPTREDTQYGRVDEYVKIINEVFTPSTSSLLPNPDTDSFRVNINTCPIEELDSLPGVGPVLGQKIIDGRPYTTIEELIQRKIINESVFSKIKQSISVVE